jgi:hypothetical protein
MTIFGCSFKWKTATVSNKVKLVYLALASTELGTAQPQLVLTNLLKEDFLLSSSLYTAFHLL